MPSAADMDAEVIRLRANGRATSPRRAGNRFVTMNPMFSAAHRARSVVRAPTGSSSRRQRNARISPPVVEITPVTRSIHGSASAS